MKKCDKCKNIPKKFSKEELKWAKKRLDEEQKERDKAYLEREIFRKKIERE